MPFDPRRGGVSGQSDVHGGFGQQVEFDAGLGGSVHGGPVSPPVPYTPPGMPPPPNPYEPPLPSQGGGGAGPANQGAATIPTDLIGDIPPPPVPPPPISGPGVGGIAGTEAGTFARPGSRGVLPLHTAAFTNKRPPRFGPGTPTVGASPALPGLDGGLGISPEAAADLLRRLASGNAQG